MMVHVREAIRMYLVLLFVMGVLVCLTSAAPTDQERMGGRHKRQEGVADRDGDFLKGAYRTEIMDELDQLERVEAMIAYQLKSLSSQRDEIRARKRGIHNHCFLNLVACYKRR